MNTQNPDIQSYPDTSVEQKLSKEILILKLLNTPYLLTESESLIILSDYMIYLSKLLGQVGVYGDKVEDILNYSTFYEYLQVRLELHYTIAHQIVGVLENYKLIIIDKENWTLSVNKQSLLANIV